MKTFFNSHNSKALEIVNTYKNMIYSYLMADPSKTKFNHILTVPVSQRNDNNGWPNFRFDFQEKVGLLQKMNVRVETNTFQNSLIIRTSKVAHLLKCDLLVFPGRDEESVYLSFLDNWGNRNWLTDKRFYRQETKQWSETSQVTYNYYNLRNLVANGQIIQLSLDKPENKIVVIDNFDFLLPESEEKDDTRMWKEYYDYGLSTSHIDRVQFDGKQANTVFWCTSSERYTKNLGTTTKVSLYLESISTKNSSSIYQQLMKAYNKTVESGKAYCFKIPVKPSLIGNINFDQSMIDSKGNITIYVSNSPEFDVIENKVEKIIDDIKAYRKVWKWIKENPNKTDFPKKWTEEDLAIANEIMNKR